MWKNEVMPPFIEWLKDHNARRFRESGDSSDVVSIYGMDLYSLHRSAEHVIQYLERVDPEGAKAARKRSENAMFYRNRTLTCVFNRYNCFERFGEDTMRYAYETQFGLKKVRVVV